MRNTRIKKYALVLGLALGAPLFAVDGVCKRTPLVRVQLVSTVEKSCEAVTANDLANLDYFQISFEGSLVGVNLGDLAGLDSIRFLYFNCNDNLSIIPGDLLVGKKNLDTLAIHSNPQLTALPEALFIHLIERPDQYIMLMRNGLKSLPQSFYEHFANRKSPFRIELDRNPLSQETINRIKATFAYDKIVLALDEQGVITDFRIERK